MSVQYNFALQLWKIINGAIHNLNVASTKIAATIVLFH